MQSLENLPRPLAEGSLFTELTWGRTKGRGRQKATSTADSVVSFQRTLFVVVCRDRTHCPSQGAGKEEPEGQWFVPGTRLFLP